MAIGLVAGLTLASQGANLLIQRSASKRSEAAQQERGAISSGSQQVQDRLERRRLAKSSRIARAAIVNSSGNTGTTGSSGELGALSAERSSVDASIAGQGSQVLASRGITQQNNQIASAESRALGSQAFTNLFKTGLNIAEDYFG